MIDHIGLAAAICTSLAFVPQAVITMRTRRTHDISLAMYVLFVTGISLWLVYGLLIDNLPIILANVVTLGLSSIILAIKVINIKGGKDAA